MVTRFRLVRKLSLWITAFIGVALLAACQPSATGGPQIDTRDAVPVALLVPQAGSTAGLAQDLENAARLAAGDLSGAEIALQVYNTGGTAAGAAGAATQAVADGAKIIIGPLFADAAAAAGSAVAGRGINVLSFSNNPAVAGGNVFILGSTFQNTANRLAGYAARSGVNDIAIVHGASTPEELGRDAIARALAANGQRLSTSVSFPLSQSAIVDAAPGIAAQVTGSGATGIFLTSGNDGALPFLVETLPNAGLGRDSIQYIGLQRLDIPSSATSLPGLQGAWFALPDPGLSAQFRARYQAAYGTGPHPLAGLAYDGVAAVGALVSAGQSDALTGRALTRPSGFAGVGGIFRLLPNGTNERGLAVAQIQNSQVAILDPAPRSFGGPGF